MLEYFTLILVCELIGEFAVTTMGAPFPGPVVGMVLLFVFLSINHRSSGPGANHYILCTLDFQRNTIGCNFHQQIYTETWRLKKLTCLAF